MPTIAELQIKVNTTDLDRAKKSLDDLAKSTANLDKASEASSRTRTKASEQVSDVLEDEAAIIERVAAAEKQRAQSAAASSGTLASSYKQSSQAVNQFESAVDNAATSQGKLQASTKTRIADVASERQAYRQLIASIDPTTAALQKLEDQQRELNALQARGKAGTGIGIDPAEFTRLNTMIEASRKRIGDLGATTGKTAKEINFAMRGLPAQFTDIAVSLQGGQAPLTVFLQQGGQIKDMFGGVGPALRAMAGYAASLISPLTLAAAALGALAVGFVVGSREASAYNKALITTGNIAGVTADSLAESAKAISDMGGTQGAAAKALVEVASVGRFTAAQIDSIAEAAVRMNSATGKAVSDTVGEFEALAKEPSKAILDLNSKYHFLTSSVFEQIQALENQGRTQDAATLAIETYSNTLQSRTTDIKENLGVVESAWNAVTGAAKRAGDAILNVGRDSTFSEQISDAEKAVRTAERARDAIFRGRSEEDLSPRAAAVLAQRQKEVDLAKQYVEELRDEQEGERLVAEQQAFRQRIQDKAIASGKKIEAQYDSSLSTVNKLKKQLSDLSLEYDNIKAAGTVSAETEKRYQDTVAATTKRLKEAEAAEAKRGKGPKTPAVREGAGVRLLATMKQQEESLIAQRDATDRIGTEEQKLIKLREQFRQIEQKQLTEKLTKEQTSLLANKEALLAQQQKNAEVQKEIVAQKELEKLATVRAALEQQIAVDRQKYEDALIGATSSDKEAERLRERNRLEQDYQRQLQEFGKQNREGSLSDEGYQEATAQLAVTLAERRRLMEEYYSRQDQMQGDWVNGAKKAYANWAEEGRNVAGMTQSLFSSAFSSMEDALTGFVTTGKLSFKDLTVSILKDLAAMATKIAANQILTSIIGSFGGGLGGAATSASAAATTSTGSAFAGYAAKGKAFSGGVEYFANGGAFTNSIVNRPTAFGTGTGIGVMGEAGPEAIMPLTRTSDGQLGVKGMGGGSTVVAPVSVTIQTDGGMGGQGNGSSTNQEGQGRAVQMAVKSECERAIANALKPGGRIWLTMNGR